MKYISLETLGKIDNSHMALADKDPEMAYCHKCIKLSELHSIAVDFVKTG